MGNQSVIVDGLANLPEAFVWVFIGKCIQFIAPKAQIHKMQFLWVKKYTVNLHFLIHEFIPKKL